MIVEGPVMSTRKTSSSARIYLAIERPRLVTDWSAAMADTTQQLGKLHAGRTRREPAPVGIPQSVLHSGRGGGK